MSHNFFFNHSTEERKSCSIEMKQVRVNEDRNFFWLNNSFKNPRLKQLTEYIHLLRTDMWV